MCGPGRAGPRGGNDAAMQQELNRMKRIALSAALGLAAIGISSPTKAHDFGGNGGWSFRWGDPDHGALHDELAHREFHRELYHREAHRYPMSWWQHERLHDQLDHDAFHDQLSHRAYHYDRFGPPIAGFGGGYGRGY